MRNQIVIALFAWASTMSAQQQLNLPVQPVGPNDLVTVTVYKQEGLSGTQRVSAEGTMQLPMLKKEIKATGMMPGALARTIAQAYIDEEILVDPQVTVTIAEYHSHPIHVSGSVRTPVTFQAETPVTLLDAINKAGGLTETAGQEILVTRKGEVTRRISVNALFGGGDETLNMVLSGGEEVRIPEAGRVFVVGNVKKPCNYLITQGNESTVLKAMSYSEGLQTYSSKTAYIYRREGSGGKNEIEIPLRDIMARKAPDVHCKRTTSSTFPRMAIAKWP